MDQFADLFDQLGHRFDDVSLLELALTHRSVGDPNNERLEFLGDAVLDTVISAELVDRYPDADEGQLSRMRSALVSGDNLARLATGMGLESYIRIGTGERVAGGLRRRSLLADTLEAVVGAIYRDAGFEACARTTLRWFAVRLDECSPDDLQLKDAKTRLQEWMQAQGEPLPTYRLEQTSGPQHRQRFVVSCVVSQLPEPICAEGSSVKRAEQSAAEQVLRALAAGQS